MRGPRPTPTPILKLRGSWRAKTRAGEPNPPPAIPPCPRHLDAEARREWRRVTPLLAELKILAKLDRAILAAYCSTWSRLVEAQARVARDGMVVTMPSGASVQNPYLSIVHRATEQLQRLAAEFGLSPASRARVKAPQEAAKPDDLFADLERTG